MVSGFDLLLADPMLHTSAITYTLSLTVLFPASFNHSTKAIYPVLLLTPPTTLLISSIEVRPY